MSHLLSLRNTQIVLSVTFVSLLGIPIIGPAMPAVQKEFGIANADIGWMMMSSFALPALVFVPLTAFLADTFGKKMVIVPSIFVFSLAGTAISFAPNAETIVALRFLQGAGASCLSTLNVALVPDLFSGRDRVAVTGYTSALQNIGAGILPLVGGILAGLVWYYPFLSAALGIPLGFFVWIYLDNNTSKRSAGSSRSYFGYAWSHIRQREVLELCFMTFGFIFTGFGAFISYIPTFMNDRFGVPALIIGFVISARALSGTMMATFIAKLTDRFTTRQLITCGFLILALGMAVVPVAWGPFGILISGLCYGGAFGIIRPLVQVHLLNIAPDNLRSTFSSMNGLALRIAHVLAPAGAGALLAFFDFDALYFTAAGLAVFMALFSVSASALKGGKKAGELE